MTAQRHDDHGAVSVKISAFVKSFVSRWFESQGGRGDRREFLSVRGNYVAPGLNARIGCELQLFAREQHRQLRKVHQAARVVFFFIEPEHPEIYTLFLDDAPRPRPD